MSERCVWVVEIRGETDWHPYIVPIDGAAARQKAEAMNATNRVSLFRPAKYVRAKEGE